MSRFVEVKALAGFHYVRADQVIGVSATEPVKCNIILSGGVTVPCSESAKDVLAKVEAAAAGRAPQPAKEEIK